MTYFEKLLKKEVGKRHDHMPFRQVWNRVSGEVRGQVNQVEEQVRDQVWNRVLFQVFCQYRKSL
jgi:hypothetical protein